jgi:hypothetical protein
MSTDGHRWHQAGDAARRRERLSMVRRDFIQVPWGVVSAGILLVAALLSTGCQVEMAGQTLPSPYYLTDDVQYYAPGPEFKLAREAAALKEHNASYELGTINRDDLDLE